MLMASPARKTRIGLIVMVIFTLGARPADAADGCDEHPTFGNISGSRDTVLLSGAQAAKCRSEEKSIATTQVPGPYYTEQIVCSTDPVQAAEGLCSATPCPTSLLRSSNSAFPGRTSGGCRFSMRHLRSGGCRPRCHRGAGLRGREACEASGWGDWGGTWGAGVGEPSVVLLG
jgi:hypothetical protein